MARNPKLPRISHGEETLWLHLKSYKLEKLFSREYSFHPDRNWRLDFAIVDHKIGIEVEGGTKYGKSRHSKGAGFVGDCDKYNAAAREGWQVYRFTTDMVTNAAAVDFIRNLLRDRGIA
ncbi:MAG: DUF559 domain-containing protein [Gammaproteobacteria bacterium]|nr:DUF559 domain-containing protein [Gammaproteobacteria bacterium]